MRRERETQPLAEGSRKEDELAGFEKDEDPHASFSSGPSPELYGRSLAEETIAGMTEAQIVEFVRECGLDPWPGARMWLTHDEAHAYALILVEYDLLREEVWLS